MLGKQESWLFLFIVSDFYSEMEKVGEKERKGPLELILYL